MRAPEFWTTGAGPWPYLLAPLGCLYAATGKLERRLTRPHKAPVPVICVGNLTAGGTGKTPVALKLARLLAARGSAPGFVTRGYGGQARGPLAVDPETHDATTVGDEALLLAASAPTWLAEKRRLAVPLMIAAGCDHLILDDGHQDPALVKDVSLVVVDGETGFGNGRCIPAGPLREPVADGLARAQAVIVMGEDRTGLAARVESLHPGLPVLEAWLAPDAAASELKGRRVFAFAGIGRPDKFRATLEEIGVDLQGFRAFADHHRYGAEEIEELLGTATALDAAAVTTAKDHVRLPEDVQAQVLVVGVEAAFADEPRLLGLIEAGVSASAAPTAPDRDG
ncbi:MAG: tetraacyldisaccharide 4'-kinase [Alphaproteobacteria bacterium]|nr:tetraacyldisaccharide 4'-kinase [Alphaproteobacteria bacterium]